MEWDKFDDIVKEKYSEDATGRTDMYEACEAAYLLAKTEPVSEVPCSDRVVKPCSLQRGVSIAVTNPTMKKDEFSKAIVFNIEWIENTVPGIEPYWRIKAAGFDRNGKRFDVSGGADKFERAL